mgnify:FL=1|jgi:hypothetical protein
MDIFTNIVRIQNKLLLEKIADIKFTEDIDKQKFIDCYFKRNYHIVKITRKTNLLKTYEKKIKMLNI